MERFLRNSFLPALMFCTIVTTAHADDQCVLRRAVSVDMTTDQDGRVNVPMTIGGHRLSLLVDTGGINSMLTESTVKMLYLNPGPIGNKFIIRMFGGIPITEMVAAPDVEFGGLRAPNLYFLVIPAGLPTSTDGILSNDVLRAYDAEFDFANNKFNLYDQNHCPGRVVSWTSGPVAIIDVNFDASGHIELPVTLDGKEFKATVDTGSSNSVMSLDAAEDQFKIDEKDTEMKVVGTAQDGSNHTYRYPFKVMTIGGITVLHPDIVLFPNSLSHTFGGRSPKIIIGIGLLRQLHIYIAYGEHKMYVTPASQH